MTESKFGSSFRRCFSGTASAALARIWTSCVGIWTIRSTPAMDLCKFESKLPSHASLRYHRPDGRELTIAAIASAGRLGLGHPT